MLFTNRLKTSHRLSWRNNCFLTFFTTLPATCNKIKSFWICCMLQAAKIHTLKIIFRKTFVPPRFQTNFLQHLLFRNWFWREKNCFELKIYLHISNKRLWIAMKNKFRVSRWQVFIKIAVLYNLANFTEKYLCWIIFLIKFLIKHRWFLASFFTEHLRWVFCEFCSKLTNSSFFGTEMFL